MKSSSKIAGWKLVPTEPTINMNEHGSIASDYDISQNRARDVYRAMINAAPEYSGAAIPFSGADETPPVFGRRWRLADDGFGLQRDDSGNYVHIDDALSVLHAAIELYAEEAARRQSRWYRLDAAGVEVLD